ncbi:hypothetical protein V6C27_00880 [Peptococcaceae bacterium 1198_IL3148]
MTIKIDVGEFVKKHQEEIESLVYIALDRAGQKVKQQVDAGLIKEDLGDVMPVMLHEMLRTHTVYVLRLAAEMIEESTKDLEK